MPDPVNPGKSVAVWAAMTRYVLRNPALALPKLERHAWQNLCGSTAFIDRPKVMDFVMNSRKPANRQTAKNLTHWRDREPECPADNFHSL
jgi:hypothetical protein